MEQTKQEIAPGQTYQAGDGSTRSPRWRVLSVNGETARAVRVRKADGKTWEWDQGDEGRDFSLAIIAEHWTFLG